MTSDDIKMLCYQEKPLNVTFHDCWVSAKASDSVSQTITSLFDPSFRDEVPVSKYINGSITICDGHVSHQITFHAGSFTIHKDDK